jgi:putative MATE family efflux protein
MSKTDLTTGSIYQHIKRIAIPASVGFVFRTLYNVVDTFFAGKFGADALAGLSMSFPVFFIIIAVSVGIGTGATALFSIALGKKDLREYHKLILNAFAVMTVIFLGMMLTSGRLSRFLLGLLGGEGLSLEYAISYTRIIFLGSGFFLLNQLINGVLNSQGDTKSLRNVLIIGFLLNIFLDPLFMFGWFGLPPMGVAGVAIATVFTEFLGSIYMVYRLLKSPMFSLKDLKREKISLKACGSVLKQGIPSSLNMMTIVIGSFFINYFVLKLGGNLAIAGYGVALRIEQLALLPAFGINVATLALVGQNYGAKNTSRIFETLKIALIIGLSIMTLGVLLIYPLSEWLVRFFNSDEGVVAVGVGYLKIEIFTFYSYVILYVTNSFLQAIKKPMFGFYLGLYRLVILPVIIFHLFGSVLGWGVTGIWWGIVVVNWSAVVIALAFAYKQLKMLDEKFSLPSFLGLSKHKAQGARELLVDVLNVEKIK